MSKKYFLGYFNKVSKILNNYDNKDFLRIVSFIKKTKKIILVGNCGSAAMASQVSVDFTKMCKILGQ
jgi:DNA-binding MurR/RpiR family transcriptional regulator